MFCQIFTITLVTIQIEQGLRNPNRNRISGPIVFKFWKLVNLNLMFSVLIFGSGFIMRWFLVRSRARFD